MAKGDRIAWRCFCGKYNKMRYRGIICDLCETEVIRIRVKARIQDDDAKDLTNPVISGNIETK